MAARAQTSDRTTRRRWPGPPRRRLAALRTAAALTLAAVLLAVATPREARAQEPVPALEGAYFGIGSARGMSLSLEAEEEPSGVFVDSNGIEAEIGGGWRDGGLEALLNFPGRPVWARFDPAPVGVAMTVLPLDPEGRPIEAQARVLAFLREGTPTPDQSGLYMDPPKRADGESDPDVFLASYQFWPPEGVYNGFAQIGARYRTMIRFFPQVHADVLWKLCEAEGRDAQALLAESLRGQGADCAAIRATVTRLQEQGRFDEWKRAVSDAIDAMMPAVQCARGYIVKEEVCAPASKRIAEAAVSLETVGTLLARWR
ncbi:MAG: hypothetical protein R6V44_15215 [Paracoccaceae bacterium]